MFCEKFAHYNKRITTLHDNLVEAFKIQDLISSETDLVTANEFRYTLRLYLDAVSKVVNSESQEFTDEAKELFIRTEYQLTILFHDTVDVIESSLNGLYKEFRKSYGITAIQAHIDVSTLTKTLTFIQNIIHTSRKHRNERKVLYQYAAGILDMPNADIKKGVLSEILKSTDKLQIDDNNQSIALQLFDFYTELIDKELSISNTAKKISLANPYIMIILGGVLTKSIEFGFSLLSSIL